MTQPTWSSTMRGLSSMPIVTKNKPSSTSRNGLMSSSTWCLNSVSEISIPATKAPSASESPAISVSHASPSVTSSTFSVKSSCDLRFATRCSHQRNTRCPPASSTASSAAAFSIARPRVQPSSPGSAASAGITTSSGTTARSWNSSTPTMRLPCSVSSCSRSEIIFMMIAVDDIASAAPRANAPARPTPKYAPRSQPAARVIRIVSPTWAPPRPKTMRRIDRNRGSENSSPIENIRNTTPNSAR